MELLSRGEYCIQLEILNLTRTIINENKVAVLYENLL
jgi:hypothetical protein